MYTKFLFYESLLGIEYLQLTKNYNVRGVLVSYGPNRRRHSLGVRVWVNKGFITTRFADSKGGRFPIK